MNKHYINELSSDERELAKRIRTMIETIEPDFREGLSDTPVRVVKSHRHIFGGYTLDPKEVLGTMFESEGAQSIIILQNIEMYSMCEHHILPFFGKVHVAYIPGDKIVGISKLARLVDVFARRLQNQERITRQIVDAIMKHMHAKGAACIIEAKHLCMMMRGCEKQNSIMKTSEMRGCFIGDDRESHAARNELMSLLK